MRVQFIVHEAFEAPGVYEGWGMSRGHELAYARLYAGDSLPQRVDDIDMLVVMGGPQSPATTVQECWYFDAAAEEALVARLTEAYADLHAAGKSLAAAGCACGKRGCC